jgi:hypothetical protein
VSRCHRWVRRDVAARGYGGLHSFKVWWSYGESARRMRGAEPYDLAKIQRDSGLVLTPRRPSPDGDPLALLREAERRCEVGL